MAFVHKELVGPETLKWLLTLLAHLKKSSQKLPRQVLLSNGTSRIYFKALSSTNSSCSSFLSKVTYSAVSTGTIHQE